MDQTTREEARALLRAALSDPAAEFRDGQWEAIDALVNRRERLLVIQRTGWGKSAVYFVATKIITARKQGPTLIISPLLSLMRNQYQAADRMGLRAQSMNSTNTADHPDILRAFGLGKIDALLVSPERLAHESFTKGMREGAGLGLFVVDEAHCISDWGHDFRPDYRRISAQVLGFARNLPVLATTATANERVRTDVSEQLGGFAIQAGPLTRDSLYLERHWLASQVERLAWLAHFIPRLEKHGSGIIYVLTRRDAHLVAAWLQQHQVRAHAYHSDVVLDEGSEGSAADRAYIEQKFLKGEGYRVLVATVALGMGFDKPDLRFVVHFQTPASIIAYYQQVGRAGRGIPEAECILLGGGEDASIHHHFRESAFPEPDECSVVLDALENGFPQGASIDDLQEAINLDDRRIERVLKYLAVESSPPVFVNEGIWRRSLTPYEHDGARAARVTEQREAEWAELHRYHRTDSCLMGFLARALDDPNAKPCGRCASCSGARFMDWTAEERSLGMEKAAQFIRDRPEKFFRPRCSDKQLMKAFLVDKITNKELQELGPKEGRSLSRWGDGGWGEVVAACKQEGHFDDSLVKAAADLLSGRWKLEPKPVWLTCLPSPRRNALVADFARRLAARLRLDFVGTALTLKRVNEEQKAQMNIYHRCRNLDGLFLAKVPAAYQGKPVILVDDIVDSRWSLWVASVHLRRAGSGRVHPFALASASWGR